LLMQVGEFKDYKDWEEDMGVVDGRGFWHQCSLL
jgi:hypothetical protein